VCTYRISRHLKCDGSVSDPLPYPHSFHRLDPDTFWKMKFFFALEANISK